MTEVSRAGSSLHSALIRTLYFFAPPDDGNIPEFIAETSTEVGKRNYGHDLVKVAISDVNNSEHDFTLETHAFVTLPRVCTEAAYVDLNDQVMDSYISWVKQLLLQEVFGATKVIVFDCTRRKASALKTPSRQVHKIHIDQSTKGAWLRAEKHFTTAEVELIKSGMSHFRIINVWKPLSNPVTDHPLVFAESPSVSEGDLVPVQQIYPHYIGETYAVKYNPCQRFWYWSDMTPQDVLLLQCFDSAKHARCAHGSFKLAESGDEPCDRESIEVRCMVLVVTHQGYEKNRRE